MLTVKLLGQFDVQRDGTPVEIPSRPAQSLLAYLMLNAGTAQRRERLAGLLWPDASESNARANLRHALWRLRQAIGPEYILADRVSVSFDANAKYWLDVAVLQSEPREERSANALIEIVSVYAGELLPGFYEEWVTWERERLNAVYEDRVQVLLERLVAEQRWRETCEWAERWIAGGQVPEPAYRALMLAHAGLGDRAGMAEVYQRCLATLEAELGVPPSQETVQLFQQLSRGETAPRPPVEAGLPRRRSNLPTPPTPFVGREALLAEIATRLQEPTCRLLTLVGPGGCGKTRLALEAAAARLDEYEHGVFFVSLAPLEAVEEIVPSVAQAVGFAFYGAAAGGETVAPRQQLLNYLRNKQMLLVMDNYEHMLAPPPSPPVGGMEDASLALGGTEDASPPLGGTEGGTELVTDILHTAPQVKILATSRANLNLQDEHLFPIPGMDVPDTDALERATDYSAVKLFLDAARRAQPRFEASGDNLKHIAHICRLVEGMPLRVLLAAGWIRTLTPAEIAVEIEQGLDILETDLRDVPERQRSVRAVFDHSWRLLTAQEQDVLAQLSVFRGGFTRRAAQAVAGATLRALKGLVDKSLLQHTPGARYELHELLRQYVAENLARAPERLAATRDRHGAYYAGFLARRAEQLKGPRQQAALAEIETDAENARAAWNWAVEQGQVEWLDQAMEGLGLFYDWRGRYEQGERACRRATELLAATGSADASQVCARILTWQNLFCERLGHLESARRLVAQSLSLLDSPQLAGRDTRSERAFALHQMGSMEYWSGDPEQARRAYERSLELYRGLDDRWGAARAMLSLGWTVWVIGAYDEAIQLTEESLAMRRALGDNRGIARSLADLSLHVNWLQGRFEEAERWARESVAISQRIDDRSQLAGGLNALGHALLNSGKFSEASSMLEESIAIHEDLGWLPGASSTIAHLSFTQLHLGLYEAACAQAQTGLTLGRKTGWHLPISLSLSVLGSVALAMGEYDQARRLCQESAAANKAGGAPEDQFFAIALLGHAAYKLGQIPQAQKHLYQALQTAAELGRFYNLLWALPATALLLAEQSKEEWAVELYALASRYRLVGNSHWFEDVAGKYIAAVAATLPPDVVAAAQARGRARDLEATARELLEELQT